MKRKNLFPLLLCSCLLLLCPFVSLAQLADAQPLYADSTTVLNAPILPKVAGAAKFKFQPVYMSVPLIVTGIIEKKYDPHFRQLRHSFVPKFRQHGDDYMQFAPLATMVGLKIAGVPSRSNWKRMLLSDATSALLMAGIVNSVKRTSDVKRPDGSTNNSFPSGHTATAFMTATMLSKEYGHLSPWVSIGAYTLATSTGLMRIANNRHWLSDVMVGAGIGILSTEFGYWIVDAFMKNKGLNAHRAAAIDNLTIENPSFIGLYTGFNMPLNKYQLQPDLYLKASTSTTFGLEGAWFFNRYLGAGMRTTLSTLCYHLPVKKAAHNIVSFYNLAVGPYISYPLTTRWLIGSQALLGYIHYNKVDKQNLIQPSRRNGLSFSTGLSITFKSSQHLGFTIFSDYNVQSNHELSNQHKIKALTTGFKISLMP